VDLFVLAALAAAMLLTIGQLGFDPPLVSHRVMLIVTIVAILVYFAHRAVRVAAIQRDVPLWRRVVWDATLLAIGIFLLLLHLAFPAETLRPWVSIYLTVTATFGLTRYGLRFYQERLAVSPRRPNPAKLISGSFLTVILIGTLLLSLPTATKPINIGEKPYQWRGHVLNALFTSTSAMCVTGLTVYDPGTDFTLGGQAIILALIQIGGLGIMMYGALFGILVRQQLGLRETVLLQDQMSQETLGAIRRMVAFIVVFTFIVEAIGVVLLYPMWREEDVAHGGRLFWSVFHAVSAFCNAGFSLSSTSLIPYRHCWAVYGAIMPLIVVGGLGFPVLYEIRERASSRLHAFGHRLHAMREGALAPLRPLPKPLSLHTKLVLVTTVVLLILGTVTIALAETPSRISEQHRVRMDGSIEVERTPDAMYAMGSGERWLSALFTSVTARTAGFTVVRTDEQAMSSTSHLLLCLLMFIGGSPGSCAGGIKTVVFAMLILGIRAALRGREDVEAFHRTIAFSVVRQSAAIMMMMGLLVLVITTLLSYFEAASLRSLLFETISASGTVGLTTGITHGLTRVGKVLIIVAMFAGRIGPLTLLVALAGREDRARYAYPQERPIIG
jgi:trk system potassium uptake protein TrkH